MFVSRKNLTVRLARLVLAMAVLWLPYSAKAQCTITASGLIFGQYNPLGGETVDGRGDIEQVCSESTSYTIELSQGQGTYSPREMNSAGDLLEYNLYTDVSRLIVWGDGTGGTQTASGTADTTGNEHSVYGRIPGGQNVSAGHYSDTIVITVTY